MTDHTDARQQDIASQLLALITAFCTEINPRVLTPPVRADSRFNDLGLDSLARAEMLSRIEQTFHVHFPLDLFSSATTPADVLRALISCADLQASEQSPRTEDALSQPADELDPPDHAQTLVEALRWHATRRPEQTHVVFADDPAQVQTLTYGALHVRARRIAHGLRALGIAPGDTVALMLPTSLEYFTCFAGVLLAGGIAVPVYPPTHAAGLADHLRRHVTILSNAGVRTMIVPDGAETSAALIMAWAPILERVVAPHMLTGDESPDLYEARSTDVALLQYTSGSTGAPKGVMLTHANLLANIRAMGHTAGVSRRDVLLSWLPLYHDMGLIGAWLGPLYFGVPLVLMSPMTFLARPVRWLQTISRYRTTITAAPNFAYERCATLIPAAQLQGIDLSSLRIAFCGAEPVSAHTMRAFAERFTAYGFDSRTLTPVYGLAENTLGITFTPPGRGLRIERISRSQLATLDRAVPAQSDDDALELVSCGAPLPSNTVRIIDANGRDTRERVAGRIEFRSPSATQGYYRNEAQTARLFHDGWLDTGDMGYLSDGELFITGRVKDLVIRAGRHFFPYELEEAVSRLRGVRHGCVAACGMPDPRTGTDRLIVIAETRETAPEEQSRIRSAISDTATTLLGAPPEEIALVPPHSILKTSSGKIRHADTLSRYVHSAGRLKPTPRWRQLAGLLAGSFAPVWRRVWRRTIETSYGCACWLLLGLIGVPVWLAATLQPSDSARNWRIASHGCRLFIRLARIRLTVAGTLSRASRPSTILVANHASYLDGLVLLAALPEPICIVAKKELAANHIAGPFLQAIGTRFVERHDYTRSITDEHELIAQAMAGVPLLFFAEGTFVRAAGVRPFRLGAFVAACAADLPVTPIAIAGTRARLPDGQWLLEPGEVSVSLLDPIEAHGTDIRAAVDLRDRTREAISRACGEPLLSIDTPADEPPSAPRHHAL
jgi:fatty-acyl-CoA synthase